MKKFLAMAAITAFTFGMAQETPKKSCCAGKDKKECSSKDKKACANKDKKSCDSKDKKACCDMKGKKAA